MNPSNGPEHSTLEVDGLDYSTLEVDDGNLPQSHRQDASYQVEKTVPVPVTPIVPRTICGLRRRTFWIVIIVVLVIIAAAVGGGVGGSEAAKSKASTTTPTSSSSTISSTLAPSSSPTGLLANSALASVNYTDQSNVDHVRVYYQVASKAIYQSAWNSSAKSWTVMPVTTAGAVTNVNTDMDVLPQTPISANIYWHSSMEIDFHVYYLNSASALQELWIDGPASGDGPWNVSPLDGQYSLSTSSRMISYGRACANCFDMSMIVYEGAGNDLKLVQLINNFQQSTVEGSLPTPVTGSAFAIVPGAGNIKAVAMYINGVNLDEIYYNGSDWTWTQKLTGILSPTASIAAFAYGINGTTSGSNGIEVFFTNSSPSSSNTTLHPAGLSLMSWTVAGGWQGPIVPSTFMQVISSSGLASNLAGKVYAVIAGNETSGSEYSLAEWHFTGTPGSYDFVGKVPTL